MTESPWADQPGSRRVLAREPRAEGAKWQMVTDQVALDAETTVRRDLVLHPGAVGIVALDDADQITLIRQYRHPVAAALWEIPAGLLDEPDEPPWSTAQRELVEEVGLTAKRWHTLIDVYSSPGMSSEAIRVFVARGLAEVDAADRPVPIDEERELLVERVPLDDAVAAVMAGRLRNSLGVVAILAAAESRARGWQSLRPADLPWPGPSWSID